MPGLALGESNREWLGTGNTGGQSGAGNTG